MSDLPKSITIDGETITPEMVFKIELDIDDELVSETIARTSMVKHPTTRRVTLYLHDGRVLKTEVYN